MTTTWPSPPDTALDALAAFVRTHPVAVLTGAGCSTESGIPDYRGPGSDRRRRPVQYREFVSDPAVRARYWARAAVGWRRVRAAQPNAAHRALAALERRGLVRGVITQNVDGLHHRAGSQSVIELHGSLARVRCLACGAMEARAGLQERLLARNPDSAQHAAAFAPDGDADLSGMNLDAFEVPECLACGGMLKPDVVFFGENVPKVRVERCWRLYERGAALLVVGSSLTVFSGYRFVLRAAREGKPVAIVNVGETRGDANAAIKVEGGAARVLEHLLARLDGSAPV